MKIDYHLYQLHFKANYGVLGESSARQGALLRVTFKDGLIGYCDCHPWVELGDISLSKQLSALVSLQLTPLLACSLRFARLDAEARLAGLSVFKDLTIPPSHQLVSLTDNLDIFLQEKIKYFKVKVGRFPDEEIFILTKWMKNHSEIKLRLDFNQKLSRKSFLDYWNRIPLFIQQSIQFVEDPYPFNHEAWSMDQKKLKVSLAADYSAKTALQNFESAHFNVHKPAVEFLPKFNHDIRLVITSYLDHPLGQMCAAYTAAILNKLYPQQVSHCGLLSHKCYQDNAFTHHLHSKGPYLQPPTGTGFGFNMLLENTRWQKL